jgi:site-specific recombinase XerD
MTALAPTLQAFFTTGLIGQRAASPHTIASYRDTWRLLLAHIHDTTGTRPQDLDLAQIDTATVTEFLHHLETDRNNTVATRNIRLAAVHSFYAFAAHRHPEHAETIASVLAIPTKNRPRRTDITWLDDTEVTALLAASDPTTRTGRRDRALIQVAVTTGLRASELTGLTRADLHLGTGAHLRCHGKGRKDRTTPLDRQTATILTDYLRGLDPTTTILFPTRTGTRMSTDALAARLALHATTAAANCPTLAGKNVTPHVLRHTAAMRLLLAGIDATVIALWLGHESTATTAVYLHADLTTKQKALDRTRPTGVRPGRYKPTDTLLAFLTALR